MAGWLSTIISSFYRNHIYPTFSASLFIEYDILLISTSRCYFLFFIPICPADVDRTKKEHFPEVSATVTVVRAHWSVVALYDVLKPWLTEHVQDKAR